MDLNLVAGVRSLAVATVLSVAVMGPALSAESLTLSGGSPGGGYLKAAAAFAEYIKKDIPGTSTTVIPGGGWTNIERLDPASKLADVAVLENALAAMAYKGTGPTKKKYDFRMLASFRGPSIAQAVTTVESGFTSFEQIRDGKLPVRIAMFERAQLSAGQALDILNAYGMTVKDINSWGGKVVHTSQGEGLRMLMDGIADMWFTGSSLFPHSGYIRLGSKKAFRLLPISDDVAKKVGAKYGQEVMKVPAGLYKGNNGSNDAYMSPVTIVTFGVRTALSDDLVYKMTKALDNHKEELYRVHKQNRFYKPETAWKNIGNVPLHPGAAKYYKEMGYMP